MSYEMSDANKELKDGLTSLENYDDTVGTTLKIPDGSDNIGRSTRDKAFVYLNGDICDSEYCTHAQLIEKILQKDSDSYSSSAYDRDEGKALIDDTQPVAFGNIYGSVAIIDEATNCDINDVVSKLTSELGVTKVYTTPDNRTITRIAKKII